VTDNIFGDIITDLGAMIQGGMGIAAGGNINPEGVSMFEPIGGSAPKYTGKNVINPLEKYTSITAERKRITNKKRKDPKYSLFGISLQKVENFSLGCLSQASLMIMPAEAASSIPRVSRIP
jgi:3-isopropylmalate dehydrogenase